MHFGKGRFWKRFDNGSVVEADEMVIVLRMSSRRDDGPLVFIPAITAPLSLPRIGLLFLP